MNTESLSFDRDFSLAEVLAAVPQRKLDQVLACMLGAGWQIADMSGARLFGADLSGKKGILSHPLLHDFEIVGSLRACDVSPQQLQHAAGWLELVLHTSLRYQMVSTLHIQAMDSNYSALEQKHEALQRSEARYRQLAEQLEQRVQSQVAEIELRQRQLYLSEKMASVGSLAAGMAHEINNPLGFIRSNLQTAMGYVSDMTQLLSLAAAQETEVFREKSRELDLEFLMSDFGVLLQESMVGADRIAAIVAHLKAFSNVDRDADADVNLNEVIQAVLDVVGDQLAAGIEVETDLRALPSVDCDRSGMGQVLFSLIQNALLATGGNASGTVRVASDCHANEIRIMVADNGCGIPPDILPRIFDPFFTTRGVGQGTGLGLTVSRDIVVAHGGRIDAQSEPGRGSTFTIRLPYNGEHPWRQHGETQ